MTILTPEQLYQIKWWESDWFREWRKLAGLTQLD